MDLTEKAAKEEREQIMLTHKEVLKLFEETECKSIEENIVEL